MLKNYINEYNIIIFILIYFRGIPKKNRKLFGTQTYSSLLVANKFQNIEWFFFFYILKLFLFLFIPLESLFKFINNYYKIISHNRNSNQEYCKVVVFFISSIFWTNIWKNFLGHRAMYKKETTYLGCYSLLDAYLFSSLMRMRQSVFRSSY